MTTKKVGIIVQARMGSTRLPGKMLLPAAGRPLLAHLIARLKYVSNAIPVIATSDQPSDDAIEKLCRNEDVLFLRGDLEDVLSRYVQAAKLHDFQVVVRITGDCPLMDPEMMRIMIANFLNGDWDYYSNLRPRSFPRGLDCEIFSRELLEKAFETRIPNDIPEYVVIPHVEREKNHLKIGNYLAPHDNSSLRWTLDEPVDYELIRRIYEALYVKKPLFLMRDILDFIAQKPELRTLNAHVKQKSI